MAALLAGSRPAAAQTDFYNTDRGRPVQIEDAYAVERYALELKLAPVRFERLRSKENHFSVNPEIAFGILPRTQVELGIPIAFARSGDSSRSGLSGVELSVLHNLNAETESWPALGLRADLLLPVGGLAAERAYSTVTGILTRTQKWARIHVNAQYTVGAGSTSVTRLEFPGSPDLSRWLVGGAVDKTYPLSSVLVTAEFFGRQPLGRNPKTEYTAGVGARYQLSPTLSLDGGFGQRLNGSIRGWYVTFGTAYSFGVRALFPRI